MAFDLRLRVFRKCDTMKLFDLIYFQPTTIDFQKFCLKMGRWQLAGSVSEIRVEGGLNRTE